MSATKQQTSEKDERIKYLRSLLITDDYKGRKVKEEALDELIEIACDNTEDMLNKHHGLD